MEGRSQNVTDLCFWQDIQSDVIKYSLKYYTNADFCWYLFVTIATAAILKYWELIENRLSRKFS